MTVTVCEIESYRPWMFGEYGKDLRGTEIAKNIGSGGERIARLKWTSRGWCMAGPEEPAFLIVFQIKEY